MTGAARMRQRLLRLANKIPDEVGRALFQETEVETTEAKRRCPVDEGTLRGTIHSVGPIRQWRTIYTLITCGGPAAPYAVYVHENLDAFHKVGQAKFIESVILESAPYMLSRVAKRMDLNRVILE
jgi:hypothetical protein